MKILSNVTMAGNVSMASNAKDQFTIGSELERDNANADELKVWANANFYNDVTLGSSSVDIVNVKGQLTSSAGLYLPNSSVYLTGSSTIYYQGQDFVDYVLNNIGGGGGGYADTAVYQTSDSYEPYGGGTGSYFSGTVFRDPSGASTQAQMTIGHISASGYSLDSDVIRLTVEQSGINIKQDGIDFQSGNDQISLSQIISAVNGGGGAITSLESTGSGESLIREINNGTAYLRTLKSTPTINVNQQTNELELEVNSNLVLTSLRSEGWLTVSGNVQLGDQSTDTTTVTGQLTASNGIEVGGNIVPTASGSYSLGSSTKPFKDIFVGSGSLSIPLAANVVGFNAGANKVSLNNNNSQIFDDGNLHVHGSGSVWINSQNDNPIRLNEQSSGSVVAGNNFFMNSGYGSSALAFGVRSWVNFDGTGATGAKTPRGSGNVASVTKNSTGNYTVTFSYAMPDANYCLQATCKNDAAVESDLAINIHYNTTPSTGSFTIQTARYGSGPVDSSYIMVCVIR